MADQVPVVRVSERYPPALRRRSHRPTLSLCSRLLYGMAGIILGSTAFFLILMFWGGHTWSDVAFPTISVTLVQLVMLVGREKFGWFQKTQARSM